MMPGAVGKDTTDGSGCALEELGRADMPSDLGGLMGTSCMGRAGGMAAVPCACGAGRRLLSDECGAILRCILKLAIPRHRVPHALPSAALRIVRKGLNRQPQDIQELLGTGIQNSVRAIVPLSKTYYMQC